MQTISLTDLPSSSSIGRGLCRWPVPSTVAAAVDGTGRLQLTTAHPQSQSIELNQTESNTLCAPHSIHAAASCSLACSLARASLAQSEQSDSRETQMSIER